MEKREASANTSGSMATDRASCGKEVELETLLERKGKNRWWLFWIFLLTSSPGIFNSMHLTSYVFLADTPPFWCKVPELEASNWTQTQIRNVSSPFGLSHNESCGMLKWNYTYFKEIGYEAALKYISVTPHPEVINCQEYHFDEPREKMSIESEWNLVCDNTPLKSTVQVAVALGKFLGAFCFGFIADKFGRKKCIIFSSLLYIVSGPLAGLTSNFSFFIAMRLLLGVAGSGVYECGYTILTEMTVKDHRTWLGCLYNISYSIGMMILPGLALITNDWRQLQYALSIPAVILLVHCWFIPESPRWLLTQGRLREAWKIVKGKESSKEDEDGHLLKTLNKMEVAQVPQDTWYKKLLTSVQRLFKLFGTSELRKRILICYFTWFVASMSYFAIALNAQNFTANKYWYIFLNGLAEAPGYVLPIFLFSYCGRKATGTILFFVGGLALLIVLVIPKGSILMMIVAMVGRLCMSAVYAVIILHTSELFPTSFRNTAIGTSLTMAQVGTMAAPYVVDILGQKAWYIPSTLCGLLAIISGLLILILPETKNKPLPDTIEELESKSNK